MRAVESPAQLHERMVEFWSDHFNVPFEDRPTSLFKIVEDRTVIRPHSRSASSRTCWSRRRPARRCCGTSTTTSSKVGAINENYGRELLELHTVGVGNYTEADVVATARLLTGWSINHDDTDLQVQVGAKRPGAAHDPRLDPADHREPVHPRASTFLHYLATFAAVRAARLHEARPPLRERPARPRARRPRW